jgi:hypothetical protein
MKRFVILFALLTGCGATVVDEGVDLPQPVQLDRPDPKPAFVEPKPAIEAPQEPAVKPEVKPDPKPQMRQTISYEAMRALHDKVHNAEIGPRANYRWTHPANLADHLLKTHGIDVLSAPYSDPLPKAEPQPAVAAKDNVIVQYSTSWCGYCKSDVKNVIPIWVAKGWKFAKPIDETANPKGLYPRYEIRFADGTVKTHQGSLSTWKN